MNPRKRFFDFFFLLELGDALIVASATRFSHASVNVLSLQFANIVSGFRK